MLVEQIYSTDEDIKCERCRTKQGTFVSLICDHNFCVLCLSFMYVKHRKIDPKEGTVKCIKCPQITTLHPTHLEIVTKTLKQQFVPLIESQGNSAGSKMTYNKPRNQMDNRKIKSQEHSFVQNNTPSTTKYFYSKCQSPNSLKKDSVKPQCINHHGQPITHICFDCEMLPLCIKCTSSSRKHSAHEVQDLVKSISIINEQTQQTLLEITEKIQRIQMSQRRFDDKKLIMRARTVEMITDIRSSFDNLHAKLRMKQKQIVEACQANLQEFIIKNDSQIQEINATLDKLRFFQQTIYELQKNNSKYSFIFKWSEIKHKYNQNCPIQIQFENENKIRFPSSSIFQQIDNINNEINQMGIHFRLTNLSRVCTTQLQNCKSQSKLKKDHNKRLKTNFVSLNSSREKKVKKNTKTEEDERRLRTQKVNMDKQKRNSKMPAYITDYINKKAFKFGSDASSMGVFQMTSPNIENSKLTSKLSKTISPEQMNYKKKDNMALIKQRIQRRTAQPTCKAKAQSGKKKKIH